MVAAKKKLVGLISSKTKNPRRWLSAMDVPDLELLPEYVSSIT